MFVTRMDGVLTRHVSKDDIVLAIINFTMVAGIDLTDVQMIGPTGRAEGSQVIIIAIDVNKYPLIPTHNRIADELGLYNCVLNTVVGSFISGSYEFKPDNTARDNSVQIDVLFVNNTELTAFVCFAPEQTSTTYSEYTRLMLLKAVALTMDVDGIDYIESDGNIMTKRVGRQLDLSMGLVSTYQHRPKMEWGEGYAVGLVPLSRFEFEYLYPEISLATPLPITSPKLIVQTLFGSSCSVCDCETTYQIMKLVDKFPTWRKELIHITALSLYHKEQLPKFNHCDL